MPLITFRLFVDTLEAVAVTGVTRLETRGPPTSLETAMLPAKWVWNIQDTEQGLVFGEQGGDQTAMSGDIYIAVGPVAQNTAGANFDNAVDMADNLKTAMRAMGTCDLRVRWTINTRLIILEVAGINYWTVLCTVSA